MINGGDCRLERAESREDALYEGLKPGADQQAEGEQCRHRHIRELTVHPESRQVENDDQEEPQPSGDQENADSATIVPVLRRKPPAELLPLPEMVEPAVAFHRSRNFTAGRAEQAYPLPDVG